MRKFLDKYKNHIKDNEIFKNVEKACKTYELSKIQEKNFSTCFLNPVEYEIFISFLKEQNVRYVVFDENGKNERKSVLFLYEKNYDLSDFYSVFKCIGDFKQVSHRDVLGSLTALGLERNDVGDIFIYDDFCEFAVLKSSSKDIYKKLFSIKNINVETLLKEDLIFSEVLETVKEKILIKKYGRVGRLGASSGGKAPMLILHFGNLNLLLFRFQSFLPVKQAFTNAFHNFILNLSCLLFFKKALCIKFNLF